MRWQEKVFKGFRVYAVTDLKTSDPTILGRIEAAYRGGADIVQLRSKTCSDQELFRVGEKVRLLSRKYRRLYFVNDRLDLALATDADGLHVGQEDLPLSVIRRLMRNAGKTLFLGKSTHSLNQAIAAEKEKPDYIGVGPVFKTPTKKDYIPVGLELVEAVSRKMKIPWVAIGGIDEANIEQVLRAGARRCAFVRAIFEMEDVKYATQVLRKKILSKV